MIAHLPEWGLFSLIAHRAKISNIPSPYGLEIGEALIGDYASCGLTRQKYRTALKNLKKWKFITTRITNKGTIAKIINSDIWDLNLNIINHQPNQSLTINQPSTNQSLTTNKEYKNERIKRIPYSEVISYLNSKTGRSFNPSAKDTQRCIRARWNEGYRLEDFKAVVNGRCHKWLTDPDMVEYLRPSTLFGTKFEGYLQEAKDGIKRNGGINGSLFLQGMEKDS